MRAVHFQSLVLGLPLFAMGCGGGICIAHADGTNLRVLVSGPSLIGPTWSPDGSRIAYYTAAEQRVGEYKIFVVDVATGETTFVADGATPEWLDDHTLIVGRI